MLSIGIEELGGSGMKSGTASFDEIVCVCDESTVLILAI